MYIYPYVRFAMYHVFLENYFIERHIWDHEIIFIDNGKMKITIEGKVYIVDENTCIILRPGVYHKIEWHEENCSQPHVHFDFYKQDNSEEVTVSKITRNLMSEKELTYFRSDFFKENGIDIPPVFKLKNPGVVKNILFKIIDEFTFNHPYASIMLQGLMSELIATIIRDYRMGQDDVSFSKAKELNSLAIYMSENVDKNFTLDDFSNYINISKWSLIQFFKKYYNTTPMNYFHQLRYYRAKNLLQYTFLSVKEISYKMGFYSPQSFSRWFKSLEGLSPNDFRKQK
jgi:YesN/AraC family two-component response regulator